MRHMAKVVRRRKRASRNLSTVLAFTAAILLLTPTVTAYEDMTSLITRRRRGRAALGQLYRREPRRIDPAGRYAVRRRERNDRLDRKRVGRGGRHRQDRLLQARRAPTDPSPRRNAHKQGRKGGPRRRGRAAGAAESLQRRQSLPAFERASEAGHGNEVKMAFTQPAILGKEVQIASVFHSGRSSAPVRGFPRSSPAS